MIKLLATMGATLLMSAALASPMPAFAGGDDDQPASCHDNCRIIITDDIPPDAPTTCHDNCTVYARSIDDATCHDHCTIVTKDGDAARDEAASDKAGGGDESRGTCHNNCVVKGDTDGASCHDNCKIIGAPEEGTSHRGKGDRWGG